LKDSVFNPHRSLIERTLEGDQHSFSLIYRYYARAMYNTALRILSDQGEAEDVLQESFLSAYTNLKTYRFEASFGAWLKKIVINKSLSLLQKRKVNYESLEETELPVKTDYSDAEDYNFPCTVKQVVQAIEKLPDGYRTILSLYLLEGYDHVEISEILNISESTSKSQYSRARHKLIQILNSAT
jgi:RNA polymerase sigma factor (sigma-70 family)